MPLLAGITTPDDPSGMPRVELPELPPLRHVPPDLEAGATAPACCLLCGTVAAAFAVFFADVPELAAGVLDPVIAFALFDGFPALEFDLLGGIRPIAPPLFPFFAMTILLSCVFQATLRKQQQDTMFIPYIKGHPCEYILFRVCHKAHIRVYVCAIAYAHPVGCLFPLLFILIDNSPM